MEFERILISGKLKGTIYLSNIFQSGLDVYNRTYAFIYDRCQNLECSKVALSKLYARSSMDVCVTFQEWIRVYYQAWVDRHDLPAYIPSQPNRIIMPTDCDIQFTEDGYLGIKYGQTQNYVASEWLGLDQPEWKSIGCLPGNIAAWTRTTNEHGEYEYDLSILCFRIFTDDPSEFAMWFKDNLTRVSKVDKKKNPAYATLYGSLINREIGDD